MPSKRSKTNQDLFWGLFLLSLSVAFVYMILICKYDKSYEAARKKRLFEEKEERNNYFRKRGRIWRWRQEEFEKKIKDMTEPVPESIDEAQALALNVIYKQHVGKLEKCSLRNGSSYCNLFREMESRRKLIRQVCSTLQSLESRQTSIDSLNFLVLKYRKLVWCPVYKAASSTWMQQIPLLTNYKWSQSRFLKRIFIQPNDLAKAMAPPLPHAKLRTFLRDEKPVKLIIVRHPFDRFLSAYRDKLESMNEYFHKNYGFAIVAKYRSRGISKFGRAFYSNSNGSANGCPLADKECSEIRGRGSTPTFWEFVQAVLYDGITDGHWNPVHQSCSVCLIEFDFILKFENLEEEQKSMLQMLELTDVVYLEKIHENKRRLTHAEKMKYFGMLDKDIFLALVDYYRHDFDLFGYDPNDFFSRIKRRL